MYNTNYSKNNNSQMHGVLYSFFVALICARIAGADFAEATSLFLRLSIPILLHHNAPILNNRIYSQL